MQSPALQYGRSPVDFLHIFGTTFPKNTSGGLLLNRQAFFNINLQIRPNTMWRRHVLQQTLFYTEEYLGLPQQLIWSSL